MTGPVAFSLRGRHRRPVNWRRRLLVLAPAVVLIIVAFGIYAAVAPNHPSK